MAGETSAARVTRDKTEVSTPPARAWVIPVALILGLFTIFASTASRVEMHIDAHAATVEAWHLAATGSPWLEGDLNAGMASNPFIFEAPNGHVVAQRMAGPVIFGTPFYWLLNASPSPEDFSFVPGGLAAAFYMALASGLLFLGLRSRVGSGVAVMVTLVFALATPTWSVSSEQLWTHTVTQFGIAGAAFGASRRAWWLVGGFLGIGMLGRPHIALIAVILGLGVSLRERTVKPALQVAVPTVASLGLLAIWNRWMFGVWGIEGAYVGRAANAIDGFQGSHEWTSSAGPLVTEVVNYLGFWVAPDRGFLIWSPLVLVLLPALVRSWRGQPPWSQMLLVGGVLYTFAQLRLNYFAGGDTFWGYRHGLELLTCAVPALAFCLPYAGRWARGALPVVIATQFAAFSLGATTNAYFVHIDDVWVDNSLWVLARLEPALATAWFTLCIGVGLGIATALRRRSGLRWPQPALAVASASSRRQE